MILCEREIQALNRRGLITIDPCPEPTSRLWSSTALDLTLHDVLVQWITPKTLPTGQPGDIVYPSAKNFNVQAMMEDESLARKTPAATPQGYLLQPREFILGYTVQHIGIPHESRVAARVEGKSSLARLGLGVHVTAPTIHAGFGAAKGKDRLPIQLEIFNLGPWQIQLMGGMPICQIIFEEVREVPSAGYAGQFAEQQQFTAPGV